MIYLYKCVYKYIKDITINNIMKSIFKEPVKNKTIILSLKDIIATIPQNSVKKENPLLKLTHTEWRWRFFNINGRKMIEISKLEPNNKRIYMNNTGNWINHDDNNNLNNFIVNEIYSYVDK